MVLINPVGILLISIGSIIFCIIEQYLIFPLIYTFSEFLNKDVLKDMVAIVQSITTLVSKNIFSSNILWNIMYSILGLSLISLFIGLTFSSVLSSIYCMLEAKKICNLRNSLGSMKNIFSMTIISIVAIIFMIIIFNIFTVASVPAIFMSRVALKLGEYYYFLGAALVSLTVFSFITLFLFFRIYTVFWYISSIHFKKSTFLIGKKIADAFFERILYKFMGFDIIFLILEALIFMLNKKLTGSSFFFLLLFINWIFKTAFISFFIMSIFLLFKEFKDTIVHVRDGSSDM